MATFSDKQLAYGAIGIGVLGILLSATFGGTLLSLLGSILTFIGVIVTVAILKYGYIIIPMLTQMSNVVIMTDTGYEIPPSEDVIVKKVNDLYYASVFLGIKIYESSLEKTTEEVMAYNKFFERAMTNFKKVVKICYTMQSVDASEKRKELEAKKAEAQLRLQKEREKAEPDVLRLERLEREVAYWSSQIDKLTLGMRPMRVVIYAMVTEVGITKEEVIAKAKARGNEIITLLSNSLNAEVDFLTADEMLKAFEWEKFLPTTPEELESQTEKEKRSL